MSCLFNSVTYSSIGGQSSCDFSAPGIKKVYIASWTEIAGKITYTGSKISGIDAGIQWFELPQSAESAKFSEKGVDKYEHTFEFSIPKMTPDRRITINNLVKGKWLIIFQDKNGFGWLVGMEKGLKTAEFEATPNDVNRYRLVYKTESNGMVLPVAQSYMDEIGDLDCDLLHSELALTSEYYIWQFEDCALGDFPDFTE